MPELGWVRSFESVETLLQRLVDAVPPEPKDAEAHDRFGKPTPIEFLPAVNGGLNRAPGITYTLVGGPSEEEEEEQEPQAAIVTLTEISRSVHVKRIENPEDSEQYVEDEVIDNINFKCPPLPPDPKGVGYVFRLVLNNP